ncbi:flagellar hook-length control protein FliK [Priestia abyssalis]|uniref:flagellar hook-length control protein FliK n=1 Tax=Priestia abyssalis TaxID=1221450 RepID=UPI000994B367|nr:flagellar hook-length control protein FliK [Priestia abyssalis]
MYTAAITNNGVDRKQSITNSVVKKGDEVEEKTGFEAVLEEIKIEMAAVQPTNPPKSMLLTDKEKGVAAFVKGWPDPGADLPVKNGLIKKQNRLDFIKLNLSLKALLTSKETTETAISEASKAEQLVNKGVRENHANLRLLTAMGMEQEALPKTGNEQDMVPVIRLEQLLPMTKAEQYALHIGSAGKGINEEGFLREFQQLLGRSSFMQNGDHSKLMIKLFPEHLGALRIEIVKNEHGMTAKMIASTQQAQELLESQLSLLKQAFTNQQIHVDRVEIQQQFQPFEKFMNHGFQEHEQPGQERNEKQMAEDEQEDEENDFSITFGEALFNFNV